MFVHGSQRSPELKTFWFIFIIKGQGRKDAIAYQLVIVNGLNTHFIMCVAEAVVHSLSRVVVEKILMSEVVVERNPSDK